MKGLEDAGLTRATLGKPLGPGNDPRWGDPLAAMDGRATGERVHGRHGGSGMQLTQPLGQPVGLVHHERNHAAL
jgi:hypothetical protein